MATVRHQKITPFLWYDHQAEEAINLYISIFKDGKILHISRYGEAGPGPKGSVMTARFELFGREFLALNGGPHFKFTEAFSLMVECETQDEVDEYWDKLSDGGSKSQCGWLKDKFGLSWQIVPRALGEMLMSSDKEASKRTMLAMLKMQKLDIAQLRAAYNG
jgi:predicted 3-demethylubiquinone-9 3-methyltransferase (glyoxalase superfamily)